jgi:hypothetical protein
LVVESLFTQQLSYFLCVGGLFEFLQIVPEITIYTELIVKENCLLTAGNLKNCHFHQVHGKTIAPFERQSLQKIILEQVRPQLPFSHDPFVSAQISKRDYFRSQGDERRNNGSRRQEQKSCARSPDPRSRGREAMDALFCSPPGLWSEVESVSK